MGGAQEALLRRRGLPSLWQKESGHVAFLSCADAGAGAGLRPLPLRPVGERNRSLPRSAQPVTRQRQTQ